MEDKVKRLPEHERLRDSPLEGFRNGADLDLRLRVALDAMSRGMFPAAVLNSLSQVNSKVTPENVAAFVLDTVSAVIERAREQGMVHAFSSGDEIDAWLKAHVKRQFAYQGFVNDQNQLYARRQQEAARKAATLAPRATPPAAPAPKDPGAEAVAGAMSAMGAGEKDPEIGQPIKDAKPAVQAAS